MKLQLLGELYWTRSVVTIEFSLKTQCEKAATIPPKYMPRKEVGS
jgi:hypothetical protein